MRESDPCPICLPAATLKDPYCRADGRTSRSSANAAFTLPFCASMPPACRYEAMPPMHVTLAGESRPRSPCPQLLVLGATRCIQCTASLLDIGCAGRLL